MKVRAASERGLFAPLTAGLFQEFLYQNCQPDLIKRWQEESFERAQQAATPSNGDEDFKYVNFRRLDLEGLQPTSLGSISNGNGVQTRRIASGVGSLEAVPERFRIRSNGENRHATGHFFGSFGQATVTSAECFRTALQLSANRFPVRKFALFSQAFLSNGAFLHFPQELELRTPLHSYTHLSGTGVMISVPHLALFEKHSSGTLVWDVSSDIKASGLFNSTIDVVAQFGSKVNLLINQELTAETDSVLTARVYLERNAELEIATINTGGRVVQVELEIKLAGEGSHALVSGIYSGRGNENFHFLTHQDHQVGHTTSDLVYAGTLGGRSQASYLGKINIAPNAQRSDAYQKNRNLVLNGGVRVNSSPKLEISANDVRCTHGATTTKVSEPEMFYLRSRGISKEEAKILLSEGFLEQAVRRLRAEELKTGFSRRLSALFESWRGHAA